MATLDELKDKIYDWIDSVVPVGIVTEWEDGDDADFKNSHVSLRLLEDKVDSRPLIELDSDTEEEKITENVAFILVINTYGKQSEYVAKLLRASLWSSARSGFDALWGYVGLGGTTAIQNLSELESADIQARYEFRVTLHTILEFIFGADYAENIPVTVVETRLGTVIDNQIMGGDPHPIPENC